ncbi:MAG: AMP-binding protein [Desulfobacterium sp.]
MWNTVETIPDMLRRNVSDFSDRDAVIAVSYATGEWVKHTWRELDDITDRVAAGLVGLGLKKGMRVGFLQGNCMENYYTYLAVHKIGAVFIPVNIRLVAREVAHIVSDSGSTFFIIGHDFIPLLETLQKDSKEKKQTICMEKPGAAAPDWTTPFTRLMESSDSCPSVDISPDDDADIIYTSGTTGIPKGVVLTHANKVANGRMAGTSLGAYRSFHSSLICQTAFPFFTSAGLSTVTMKWLYYGKTQILEPMFDVLQTLEIIQREKTTEYAGAPSMLIFIMDHPKFNEFDVDSIRSIVYGGSPMPEEVIRRIFKKWPKVKAYNLFGLTEGGPGGTCMALDGHDYSKAASVGLPWQPDQDVRIVDESGNTMLPNQVGEFVLRGPNVMKGYHNNLKATQETVRDGWLYTGDMGYVDDDGYFFYTDRKKDMIIRGGFNVYPVELENVLHEHPGVFQCAVVGIPHPKLGEDIVACVVLNKDAAVTADELIAFCTDKLADFKCPRKIKIMDSLPITAMGKMDKKVIRKTLENPS